MNFLFKYLMKEKPLFFVYCFFMIFGAMFLMAQANLLSHVMSFTFNLNAVNVNVTDTISNILSNNDTNNDTVWNKFFQFINIISTKGNLEATKYVVAVKDFSLIFIIFVFVFTFISVNQIINFLRDFVSQYLSKKVTMHIRNEVFNKMIVLPSSLFKSKKSGDLVSRVINDVGVIDGSIHAFLENIFYTPIICVVGISVLFYINYSFTLVILLIVVVLGFVLNIISKYVKKHAQIMTMQIADITSHITLTVYGIDIIKIFNRETWEKKRFYQLLKECLHVTRSQILVTRLTTPITEIIGILGIMVIIFYGANLVWQKQLTINDIFNFLIVALYVTPFLQKLGNILIVKQTLDVAINRLYEIFNVTCEVEIDSLIPKRKLVNYQGKIEFKNVDFKYDLNSSTKTLDNISITVNNGQVIAFVGSSGGGKSTLLNLIPLLLEPTNGFILYDDIPHNQLERSSIRSQLAFVTQESILFPVSIKENILYGDQNASDEQLFKAAKMANIHDFILTLPNGYKTNIGERGLKLSGGQKQRISIARAILKNPKILILDEATSALDNQSEREVQKALSLLMKQQTTLVVAHRLSTILNADQIIVLDKGKIVEQGTHKELIQDLNGAYKKLYDLQFK